MRILLIFVRCFYFFAVATMVFVEGGATSVNRQTSNSVSVAHEDIPLTVAIRMGSRKFKLGETLKFDVVLTNKTSESIYVDRRMYCCGIGSGLELRILDSNGNRVPLRMAIEQLAPPPQEGDLSILVRLDEGYLYGTQLELPLKDNLPKPGRYSLRVIYKSVLHREFLSAQLRNLAIISDQTPAIPSEPLWFEITK